MAEETSLSLPLVWVAADEKPLLYVNNFLSQVQADEILLTLGEMVKS